MSTSISYKNMFGELISVQQKERIDEYTEETLVNGRLKTRREFFDSELEYECLYVYPDETLTSELATINDPNTSYVVAKDYQITGSYTTWSFYGYDGTGLDTVYLKRVYDALGRDVAYAEYDANDSLIEGGTKKYYLSGKVVYDSNNEVDMSYSDGSYILFDFTEGSLQIDVTFDLADDPFLTVSSFTDRWQDLLPFMTTPILNYFTSMEPLVPNVTL